MKLIFFSLFLLLSHTTAYHGCDTTNIIPYQLYQPIRNQSYNSYDTYYDTCYYYDSDTGCSGKEVIVGGHFTYDACTYFTTSNTPYSSLPSQTVSFYRVPYVPKIRENNYTYCIDDFKTVKGFNNMTTKCLCGEDVCGVGQTCYQGSCTNFTYGLVVNEFLAVIRDHCGLFDDLICDFKCKKNIITEHEHTVVGNCDCVVKNAVEVNKAIPQFVGMGVRVVSCVPDIQTKESFCDIPEITVDGNKSFVRGWKVTGNYFYINYILDYWTNAPASCQIEWIMGDKPLVEGDVFMQSWVLNDGHRLNWMLFVFWIVMICL